MIPEYKGRIQHKNDIEANWKLATNFTPLKGEIIIYNPDDTYSYARFKIGDGETNINLLPFIDEHKSQVQIITWEVDD
jgi:hypothetical protein